jgi:carbon storage regulator
MLILSRKSGESLVIDGRVIVKIIRTDGDTVKVGIEAPANIPVHRQEVYEEIQKANREAANQAPLTKLPSLVTPKKPSGSTPLKPANNQQQTKAV